MRPELRIISADDSYDLCMNFRNAECGARRQPVLTLYNEPAIFGTPSQSYDFNRMSWARLKPSLSDGFS
jgi:hypothetical protein